MVKCAEVVGVSRSRNHTVRKAVVESIALRAGYGVEEDAHAGATVQHRHAKRFRPDRPNERQVHLIGAELFAELERDGYRVEPGMLGENVITRGIALTGLPHGTQLHIGAEAVIEIRGVRAPCTLIDRLLPGVKNASAMAYAGKQALRHGVMGIVIAGGIVRAGDSIAVELPPDKTRALPYV